MINDQDVAKIVEALQSLAETQREIANEIHRIAVGVEVLERLTDAIVDVYDVGTCLKIRT